MPELPDVDVYVDVLRRKLAGQRVEAIRLGNPFVLRSVEPAIDAAIGQTVSDVRRIGKRIAVGLDNDVWLVIHLMIAGRLQWHEKTPTITARNRVAAFDFGSGSLLLTEAGTKKRASLYLAAGESGLQDHDRGGLEPLECTAEEFAEAVRLENHTLKRTLTDQRIFSGIGNAYSDEILHVAKLSPVALSQKLDDAAIQTLFEATRDTLSSWRERLLTEADGEMPEKVTAFRPEMRVHGRFGKPCPECGAPVQRIRYKSNETNYCAACQTGSRILKDRSLSRLLKEDWPKTLDEL
ncbi:MAG: DNA-formamidopyrimidine glycosylase family protein [Woeseiaceae bacterium]|nr:DNA-formamidopyrimidine glycosylase family protein [Woeseiaceae bacterium]